MFAPVGVLQEIHRLQDSADQANKHASFFERESQRLEVRVKDLSQQVEKTLLWLNVLFCSWCIHVLLHFRCLLGSSCHSHGCPKCLGDIKVSPQDSIVLLLSKLA